jgi:hypothetical protein
MVIRPTPPTAHNGLAVSVDHAGTVVAAVREGAAAQLSLWEVTLEVITTSTRTTTRRIRACSIEEAIHRAKAAPEVHRVVGVHEVQP